MAASTASHRPIKGILKNKSSTTSTVVGAAEQPDDPRSVPEELSNTPREARTLLAPYHAAAAAADKDYGLVDIAPPCSPHNRRAGRDEDAASDSETSDAGTPALLAKKLAAAKGSEIKFRVHDLESSGDEDNDLSPEEREKKRQFEIKRKLHYNEGLNIKLARELISKDLNEEEWEEEDEEGEEEETSRGKVCPEEESSQGYTSDQLKPKAQSS
ncbi:protein phosphatase inhibitor 2-like isoform X1 [Sorex fumeus]|uniref:protein phosphatase inhibitor 2-like isoform X1 n=1 Tax=Sorex fumeus TaxID=62283 RepID=UPI0024AD7110|nr:protein phosphatase inhibitor 2-like isoform X1 [Sorex fumeus]